MSRVALAARGTLAQSHFDSVMKYPVLQEGLAQYWEPLSLQILRRVAGSSGAGNALEGQKVCDVGCGRGALLRAVAPLAGAQGSVTGIDISGGMVEYCRETEKDSPAAGTSAPTEYIHADIAEDVVEQSKTAMMWEGEEHESRLSTTEESLHLPDDAPLWHSFDRVFSLQSMHYMGDYRNAMRRHARLLKPGGVLHVGSSYYSECPRARELLAEELAASWERARDSVFQGGHKASGMKLLSAYNWMACARAAGLETSAPEVFVVPSAPPKTTFLYFEARLGPQRPTPTPSDTLLLKHARRLPKPLDLSAI